MGGRSGQRTGGGGGGAPALGTGVESFDDYKDVILTDKDGIINNLTNTEILKLAGVPKDFFGYVRINTYDDGKTINVRLDDNGLVMERVITPSKKEVYNALFVIEQGSVYKGKGADIFANQVKEAQKAGYDRLNVSAAGQKGSRYNGYYTWAVLGYQTNDPQKSAAYVSGIKAITGRDYKTWQNMMKTSTGRADWKEYGKSWDGIFDLKKGSISQQQLKLYLKQRK